MGELQRQREKFQKNRRGKGTGGNGRGEARDPNKPLSMPCFKCQKVGHWAHYCPTGRPKEQAHLAQGEEDEPTLLMVHATVQVNPNSSSPQSPAAPLLQRRPGTTTSTCPGCSPSSVPARIRNPIGGSWTQGSPIT
jgi:hypothetical protein